MWKSPSFHDLEEVVAGANERLLLCSPYISRPALSVVTDALPASVRHIELWTKLSAEDWLIGVSQPDGLLEFIEMAQARNAATTLRESSRLHAKIICSDGPEGLAGSANLTAGGFGVNLEVIRRISGEELVELREFANTIRPNLNLIDLEDFRVFVDSCLKKIDSQEALLDLIRGELPEAELIPARLIPYSAFLERLDKSTGQLENEIRTIARNFDQNNNSGKVKQAFFGIQRFLQEYPHHIRFVSQLPEDEWFDISGSTLVADWKTFLSSYGDEESDHYSYSIPTLIRYLTPTSGAPGLAAGEGITNSREFGPPSGA